MSPETRRYLIALVLVVHAIGHWLGVAASLELFDVKGWSHHSWLLSDRLDEKPLRILCLVLFVAIMIGFFITALALLDWGVPHETWRTLAVVGAVVSLVTTVIFWQALFPFFPPKVGATVVNIAILVGLLLQDWPSEANIGF